MSKGESQTFFGLFDVVDIIEIPILQRDYAQGRVEASDIRSLFLNSLFDALTVIEDVTYQPLDLDFVYGNVEGEENSVFSVLDGQQRLTTLFLLHWFLAFKNNRLEDFRGRFVTLKGESRFSYRTRPSSKEFFNALVSAEFKKTENSIDQLIGDSQWFYLSWKFDPTVQSCLTMLKAIEMRFGNFEGDLYQRLINTSEPYITFQFLNLHSFGLSDELYIKMNARGKPLTDFENFKAWLVNKVHDMPQCDEFERNLDTSWADIFWQLSIENKLNFDDCYLTFFNILAFYHNCEIVKGSYTLLSNNQKDLISSLRSEKGYIAHSRLDGINAFEQKDIVRVIKVMDFLLTFQSSKHFDLFKSVVNSSSYITQIKFYALLLFIEKAPVANSWDEETNKQFSRWLRVTNNLINNHRIDELSSFIPSIRSLHSVSGNCLELYEALTRKGFNTFGFSKSQWEEEKLKASLILEDASWDVILQKYESHYYLNGKIGFLLEIAHIDGGYQQQVFENYAIKTTALLSQEVLQSHSFELQRALLSIDDYLIKDGYNRYSFGLPNSTTYRERSENWLKVVNKNVFKTLLDKITDIESQKIFIVLQNIIDGSIADDWRGQLVRHTEAIAYCGKRLVYRDGSQIYLLTKSTRRGYHAELYSFVLDLKLKQMEKKGSLPVGINLLPYGEVYGDEIPKVRIKINDDLIGVCFNEKKYFVVKRAPHPDLPGYIVENKIETPQVILDLLLAIGIEPEAIS